MYDTQPCKFKQNDKHTLGHATDLMYLFQFFRLQALSLKTAVLPLGCRCTYSDNPQLIDLVGLTKFDMCSLCKFEVYGEITYAHLQVARIRLPDSNTNQV